MKIQIDTTAKIFRLEEPVALNVLIKTLNKIMPKAEWEKYTLDCSTKIEWVNPIIIEQYPRTPYVFPWITYSQGIYNCQLPNNQDNLVITSDNTDSQ